MEQSFLFIDDSDKIEKAIDLLKDNGYYVIKEIPVEECFIKSSSDLIELFYSTLQFFNPERPIHYSQSVGVDKKVASSFVKSRMLTGCNKKRALLECANIIKCIIMNEDKLSLSFKITSMSILGQDTLKWVTDRAISILNREAYDVEYKEARDFDDKLYLIHEQEAIDNIEEEVNNLKGLLGGLNG
jgi:hypothetical protein